jgi:hypothetical protein
MHGMQLCAQRLNMPVFVRQADAVFILYSSEVGLALLWCALFGLSGVVMRV